MKLTEEEFEKLFAITKTGMTLIEANMLIEETESLISVLELGSYTGFSTYIMAKSGVIVTAVDNFSKISTGSIFNTFETDDEIYKTYLRLTEGLGVCTIVSDIDAFLDSAIERKAKYNAIFVDSGEDRESHILKAAKLTKKLLIHDFDFDKKKIFQNEDCIDYRASIISAVWKLRKGIKKISRAGTLLCINLKDYYNE